MRPLSITIDYAQNRLKRDRISLTAAGEDFEGNLWADTYIDPETKTLILRPPIKYKDYHSRNDGIYAKLSLSDFTVTAGAWKEQKLFATDGPFIVPSTTATPPFEAVATTENWVRNQGVIVSFFNYSPGTDKEGFLDFGFDDGEDFWLGNGGPCWRVYSSGQLDFFLDGEYRETVRLGGDKEAQGLHRQYTDLAIIPFRKREYLILSSNGAAATIVRDDIGEDVDDPELIPEKPFWFYPRKGKPNVQVAKLQFKTTGYATTDPSQFGLPPDVDASPTFRLIFDIGSTGGGGATAAFIESTWDGTGTPPTFAPDATTLDCRMLATLTSDGMSTPCVYAVHGYYPETFALTHDESFDLAQSVLNESGVRLEISDSPEGSSVAFTLKDPEALELSVPKLLTVDNRPFYLSADGIGFFTGVNTAPEFHDGWMGEVRQAVMNLRDRHALLEKYQYRERTPYDGMDLSKASEPCAIRDILLRAGLSDSELDLDDVDFQIPKIPPGVCGEDFNSLADVGATGASALQSLHDQFAASFLRGWKVTHAGEKYWFKNPLDLDDSPVIGFYRDEDSAYAGLIADWGFTSLEAAVYAPDYVYGDYKGHPLEVEANEVRVTGFDPRKRKPIQAFYVDEASQDPTKSNADKPANWVGQPLIMGVLDPHITGTVAATRAVQYLVPLVTPRRYAGEWSLGSWPFYYVKNEDGSWMTGDDGEKVRAPLWKWDVAHLQGLGDFRIGAGSVDFMKEFISGDPDPFVFRKSTWTGILVGTGHPAGRGGKNLREMKELARQKAKHKVLRRPGYEKLSGFAMGAVVQMP